MRILFLYPVPPEHLQILRYQQGIGSIAAVLKQAGHHAKLLTLQDADPARIDDTIQKFSPNLIGISLTSSYMPMTREICSHIANTHKLPVILGGVHPTLMPQECIETRGVTAVCIGEGEYPMLELCEALEQNRDPTGIKNLWIRHQGNVYRNELRPLITDLDALPYPDREMFRFNKLLQQFPEAEFMGARGCPYRCAYCVNHALVQLYRGKGPYVRFRSISNLLDEIDQVVSQYPAIRWIGFHDDTFTLKPSWLEEFSRRYPERFKLPFWCSATARSITPDTVRMLKHAGCYEVRIGIESGNDYIRMNILEKPVTREDIVRAFRLLKEAGISRYAFNMVGLPYETRQTIEETIRLNQDVQPDHAFCSIFYPFPGTQAQRICEENGWLTGKNVKSYFENECALNQPGIRARDVIWYHEIFPDLLRWPRWTLAIKCLHRIPCLPGKSVWNACRRIRAKWIEAKRKPHNVTAQM